MVAYLAGNSTAYLEQVSTNSEFDRIPSSPKIIQHAEQSNTNSLRENEIVGNEDPTDEISSSGIGSTESTSPIKVKFMVSGKFYIIPCFPENKTGLIFGNVFHIHLLIYY